MKKLAFFAIATALVLGMGQCKKEQEPTTNQNPDPAGKVTITLDVNGGKADNGAKVGVDLAYGFVDFEQGDVIHVGCNGTKVGTLTYEDKYGQFVGELTNPTPGQSLVFYFLGNKTLTVDNTVDISDQRNGLPVLSVGTSQEPYSLSITNYTARLENQCALVEFVFTGYDFGGDVTVGGMKTMATVDFATRSITSANTTGDITLYADPTDNSKRYAILLPQAGVTGATVTISDADPTTVDVPKINADEFHHGTSGALTVSVTGFPYVDLGLPGGLLWATCNLGAANPEDYGDYFAWGETVTKTDYSWATYQHCENGNSNSLTKYCNNASYGHNGYTDNLTVLEAGDDAATAELGNGWRMPTEEDWNVLLSNTTNVWTTQNGVNGCLFTSTTNGNTLFLPAAGYRYGTRLSSTGGSGNYWSSSLHTDGPNYARRLNFYSGDCYFAYTDRYHGFSVRAVRSAPQN